MISANNRRAGILLLAACIGVVPLAVHSQQMHQQQAFQLSGHINYSHISPPTSGAKLLDDIFQRVRSAPQIAMARNLMKQQQQLAQLPEEALKIRPKTLQGNTRSLAAPSLQIMPQGEGTGGTLTAAFAGDSGSVGGGFLPPVNMGAHVPDVFMGSRQYPLQSAQNKPAGPGVWETQQAAQAEKKSELRQQQPMDLRTATSRFFGIANALQNAQTYGNAVRDQRDAQRQIASNEAVPKADRISYKDQSGGAGADNYNLDGETASNGAVDELGEHSRREDTATKNKKGYYAGKDKDRSSIVAASPAPAPTAAPRRKAAVAAKEEAPATYRGINLDDKKAKLAMADIALLPPNVVTGIPLVRLGSSETQANGALQAIGSMKQQKVNKWTVWSWSRPQGKTGTSLQLYMRNGLLDAMRIFDPSLIGQDFGVNLGDSLARVKEKFGEPAFILQEPGPGAGQNYVYPISQIGFQLARPNPGEQPRVVSVLIFNVK